VPEYLHQTRSLDIRQDPARANRFVDVQGIGTQNCGQYVEHRRNSSPLLQQLYSQWAQGFISGYNIGTPFSGEGKGVPKPAVRVPDEETIWLFLDSFCRNRPLDFVANGAVSLIKELGGSFGVPGKKQFAAGLASSTSKTRARSIRSIKIVAPEGKFVFDQSNHT
jgi:hypothetical protein